MGKCVAQQHFGCGTFPKRKAWRSLLGVGGRDREFSTCRLNLCAEGEYKERKKYYFGGRYTHYCVQDHNPCSLAQLRAIIYECTEWLSQDPLNVIAIHCKGGKGRTGMVVASLLLRQCIQQCPDAALDFFASKRTSRDIINGGKVKPQRVSSRQKQNGMSLVRSFANSLCLLF